MLSIEKKYDKFQYSEDECINETVIKIENAGLFPSVPESKYYQYQQSSHFPQITEPDKVISIIQNTFAQAQRS